MRLFRPGQLSLDNVSQAGYERCPAYTWLRANGSREARFEAQTVIIENDQAVYNAIREIQSRWRSNEFGFVFPQAAPRTQGDDQTAAPIIEVPVSQNSTQADDQMGALG